MFGKLSKIIIIVFCLGFILPNIPGLGAFVSVEQAHAQKKRKTLFDIIRQRRAKQKSVLKKIRKQSGLKVFKKKRVVKKNKKIRNVKKVKNVKKVRTPKWFTTKKTRKANIPVKKRKRVVTAPVLKLKKHENAAKILVVGDFMSKSLAKGLVRAYSKNPNVKIIDKTNSSSGLIASKKFNWETALPKYIEEVRPVIIVNMIGMNDRKKIRVGEVREEPLSDNWTPEYSKLASALANIPKDLKIPMLWVGLPPVRYNNMTRDYLSFNEIYRSITAYAGIIYIDIWDGFTNEKGKFVTAGPDINGHIVRLRGSKGISMVSSGRAKLAFYVEKELRKFGYPAEINSNQNLLYANFPTYGKALQDTNTEVSPAVSGTTFVLPLGTANRRNSLYLEGEPEFLESPDKDKSVSYDLVEKGKFYTPKEGRVDAGWGETEPPLTPEEKAAAAKAKLEGDKQTQNLTPANDNATQLNLQTIAN